MKGLAKAVVLLGVLASVVSGCKKGASATQTPIGGVGKPVSEGQAFDLRISPDGTWATFLRNAQKPRIDGIPPQMLLGELYSTPLVGGAPRKLGAGVANVPGGWLYSQDSQWVLFITGYRPTEQAGKLNVAALKGNEEPVVLGEAVSYMLISPDSKRLAFVDGNVLKVGSLPNGPFRELSGEVANAHFSPNSGLLAYKRKLSAAAGLFLVDLNDPKSSPRKLGDQAGDFKFSLDGKWLAFDTNTGAANHTTDLQLVDLGSGKVRRVAERVGEYDFSPDSKLLARVEGHIPRQKFGNLVVGPVSGEKGRDLGERVSSFDFAPDSTAIAYLTRFDPEAGKTGAGIMTVTALPDGAPKQIAPRVPNFAWGANGKSIAFLERFLKPIYSVDLMYYTLGEENPLKIHPGVFGYGFTPNNEKLLFRANCIREGRACDLFAYNPAKPTENSVKLIEGIYSFKSCPAGKRLIVSYAQTQIDTYDVAAYNMEAFKHQTLDRNVALPAVCVNPEGSAVAYIVKGARAGVYVAEQGVP